MIPFVFRIYNILQQKQRFLQQQSNICLKKKAKFDKKRAYSKKNNSSIDTETSNICFQTDNQEWVSYRQFILPTTPF
jgi:hypothetical protein